MINRTAGVRLPFLKPFSCVDLFNFINEKCWSQNAPSIKFEQWSPLPLIRTFVCGEAQKLSDSLWLNS
jgi:hypothetical protein